MNISTKGGDQIASTIVSLLDDMNAMNKTIIACVDHASEESEEKRDDASTISSDKRKENSDSIGNFIANRRKLSKQY